MLIHTARASAREKKEKKEKTHAMLLHTARVSAQIKGKGTHAMIIHTARTSARKKKERRRTPCSLVCEQKTKWNACMLIHTARASAREKKYNKRKRTPWSCTYNCWYLLVSLLISLRLFPHPLGEYEMKHLCQHLASTFAQITLNEYSRIIPFCLT